MRVSFGYFFRPCLLRNLYQENRIKMIPTTINKQEEIRLTAVRWFEFMSKGDIEKLCAMTDPGWVING